MLPTSGFSGPAAMMGGGGMGAAAPGGGAGGPDQFTQMLNSGASTDMLFASIGKTRQFISCNVHPNLVLMFSLFLSISPLLIYLFYCLLFQVSYPIK
jgi:hypothetical protein